MHEVVDAVRVFFGHFEDVRLGALGTAVGLQVLRAMCTARAWRNVIAAAYPAERVRWRQIYAAYLAGVGVNAVVPARGGDVARLVLAHRAVPTATYTTLASTSLVMAIFDSAAGVAFFAYALTLGLLPSVGSLPSLPSFDFSWLFRHHTVTVVVLVALIVLLTAAFVWAVERVESFQRRVSLAFSVLRPPTRYLRSVASWQALDWGLRLTATWFFLGAFHIPQNVHHVALVQVTQSLATLVPATPGGVGTEQAFIVYAFRGAVSDTRLLAFSVGVRICLTVVNVVLGFGALFLTVRTVRFRSAFGSHRAPQERTGRDT